MAPQGTAFTSGQALFPQMYWIYFESIWFIGLDYSLIIVFGFWVFQARSKLIIYDKGQKVVFTIGLVVFHWVKKIILRLARGIRIEDSVSIQGQNLLSLLPPGTRKDKLQLTLHNMGLACVGLIAHGYLLVNTCTVVDACLKVHSCGGPIVYTDLCHFTTETWASMNFGTCGDALATSP